MSLPVAILAGGLATRLGPYTQDLPKSMLEFHGEPFIAHQLRLLKSNAIDSVVLCLGHLADKIQDFIGDGSRFGLRIAYSFDGSTLRGTGGAIHQALPLLGDAFFVLYGDSYLLCDYRSVSEAFAKSGKAGLMTVYRNVDCWDRSNVEFANGRIVAYDKQQRTGQMQHIDYGLGVFRRTVFESPSVHPPCDLASIYQDLLKKNELAACEVQQRFYEIGSLEGIEEFSRFLP